ncbi:hypothetical protein HRW23_22035 [Streptomyces lunaelactis]|uniref:hypothetical protein n=1 Tax=Streptomyces lunaelactis TaxID=1535768 RepID=UPI0015856660|nr:hypothetical protein [Streptomyces lunaelactis]NUK72120.1 hypothetical protein [Streptomyces lunaelactis]NUK80028.1 hypothetical protein [Streptomyces lunaelactis]
MSDIEKAAREAVDAEDNARQLALIMAALQAQKLQPPACQHQAPVQRQSGGAAKWIGIGVGGSIFLLTVALSAIAVAISAVALVACLLILRSIWTDYRKGR